MIDIAIIQFPGSNTERETFMACERVGLNPVEFLWNNPIEQLSNFDGYIIVGGFSFYTAIEKIWCVMVTNLFAVREEADGRRKAA